MIERNKGRRSIQSVGRESKALKEIMCKFISISDVSGAGLVKIDGSVISWHTENGIVPAPYIDFMLNFILYPQKENKRHYKRGMFTQKIVDYNGHKILMSWVRADMMLLLLLDKKAYLGLTMLDMEACLREIDKVLGKCCS